MVRDHPEVALLEATPDNKSIFQNLMQLYQYDMSQFNGDETDSHGRFAYHYLDHYWTSGGIAEGRRMGAGRTAALQLFRRFPGRWQVAQERGNQPATAFWRAVIAEFTGGRFEEVDSHPPHWDGPVQRFQAPDSQ